MMGEEWPWPGTAVFQTTFSLLLPQLGQVRFRLSLAGSAVRAGVAASDAASAPLRAATGELQQRLAAAGLELPALAVSPWSAP